MIEPSLYLKELRQLIGLSTTIWIGCSYLWKICKNLGYERKRAIIVSYYRNTLRVQYLRYKFRQFIRTQNKQTLIFIDDSGKI